MLGIVGSFREVIASGFGPKARRVAKDGMATQTFRDSFEPSNTTILLVGGMLSQRWDEPLMMGRANDGVPMMVNLVLKYGMAVEGEGRVGAEP